MSTPTPTPWPTRPDGSPMRMSEMTPEQRRERLALAVERLKPIFESPEFRAALAKVSP